jgi:catechol 2,3-dioxygenase-like lactoylglutathione lyase family enzyme
MRAQMAKASPLPYTRSRTAGGGRMAHLNKLMAFVGVSDVNRARTFYRDTLGLKLVSEDAFALAFEVGGVMLRVTPVREVYPQPHTVLGWQVEDIEAAVAKLKDAGVAFERYAMLQQDESGIWNAPGGARIAWFKDPDGNTLSLAQM